MKLINWVFSWAATLLVLSDGGGGRAQTPDEPGSDTTPDRGHTRLTGTVAGFDGVNAGSVNVGGTWFDTSGAAVRIDGAPGSQEQLQSGHVVTVDGNVDETTGRGVANRIAYEPRVIGPVDSVDIENDRLTVLGQSISITPDTSFGRYNPSSFRAGDLLEISGFVKSGGAVSATRIEGMARGSAIQVSGVVTGSDEMRSRFTVGALPVSFHAARLDGFPGRLIQDGDRVEVRCGLAGDACFDESGALVATSVAYEGVDATDPGDIVVEDVEMEGFITSLESSVDFDISEVSVKTTPDTLFDGDDEQRIRTDTRATVKGAIEKDTGTVVAKSVDVQPVSRSKSMRPSPAWTWTAAL